MKKVLITLMATKKRVLLWVLCVMAVAAIIAEHIIQTNEKQELIRQLQSIEITDCRYVYSKSNDPNIKSVGTFYISFGEYDLRNITDNSIEIEFYWPEDERINLYSTKDTIIIPNYNDNNYGYSVTVGSRGYQFLEVNEIEKIISGYSHVKLLFTVNNKHVLEKDVLFKRLTY